MFLLCSIPIKYRAEGCFHRFSWKLCQLLNLEMALFVHSNRSGLFLSMDEHTGRHRKKKPHMLWANSRGKTSILWNIIQFLLNLWFCWILYQFCFVNFDEYFCFFNFVEYFLLISGWRKTLLPHQMVQVRSLKNLWSFSLKLYPRDITNWGKKKLRQGGKRDQNQPLLKVQSPNPLSFHTRTRPNLKFHLVLIYQVFVGLLLLNLAILIKNLKWYFCNNCDIWFWWILGCLVSF